MGSKIGKWEWRFLYVVAGIVDIFQWIADLTGIAAGFNEVADPFIGALWAAYFQIRGVSMLRDWKRLASLVGAVGLEEISISVAPAWIVDVWYIHRTVKREEAEMQTAQAAQAQNQLDQPIYQNGRRLPGGRNGDADQGPLYNDGVRRPSSDNS